METENSQALNYIIGCQGRLFHHRDCSVARTVIIITTCCYRYKQRLCMIKYIGTIFNLMAMYKCQFNFISHQRLHYTNDICNSIHTRLLGFFTAASLYSRLFD